MNKPTELLFSVGFHHLSTDAKKSASTLPDAQLHYLTPTQVRTLLETAAALAPSVIPPAEPELRISGETGKFVVQLRAGNLNFVSWSTTHKGSGQLSPTQIIAIITGECDDDSAPSVGNGLPFLGRLLPSMNMGTMAVIIVLVNAFTIWFVTKPPRTLTPKFVLMEAAPAERLLTEVAGIYETGAAPGDRRLEIKPDGGIQRIKIGPNGATAQKQAFTVKAAEAAGKPALVLVTKNQSLITIKDPLSVVLYGDTYKRIAGMNNVTR
jgi:hypothetical protein